LQGGSLTKLPTALPMGDAIHGCGLTFYVFYVLLRLCFENITFRDVYVLTLLLLVFVSCVQLRL
jgi:hypothetical protein